MVISRLLSHRNQQLPEVGPPYGKNSLMCSSHQGNLRLRSSPSMIALRISRPVLPATSSGVVGRPYLMVVAGLIHR